MSANSDEQALYLGRTIFGWIDRPTGKWGVVPVVGRDGKHYEVTVRPVAPKCSDYGCPDCYPESVIRS